MGEFDLAVSKGSLAGTALGLAFYGLSHLLSGKMSVILGVVGLVAAGVSVANLVREQVK